ncbi:DUF4897 domain-containing protein [Natrinema salsiterrestre]|uniref:DUF4897 domain-containing protein n=1 Tax=Natrinema salsiterrestre TaxID=2950540 RepID=A0A9Q4L507_9EURY|nr:DUF4897 domain-containing protein [Natrinema salsiterrestre]MDF9745391.1 DUF4897 domain-containing protein [Natrinema salsiterrestre]
MNRGPNGLQFRRLGASTSRLFAVVVVALLLTGSVVATADSASAIDAHSQETGSDSAFVVALEDDGDATVTVAVTFDLTDEADQAAFRSLEENETERSELESRTERRLRSVVAGVADETDREMAIEEAGVSFETDEGTDRGIVSVSATWRGFAATEDGRLTVAEPFTSGFTAEQAVVLELPDGYALAESTPEPSERADGQVSWDATTSLDGFEAVIAPSDGTNDGDSQPGFGLGAAVIAIAGGAWVHCRR